MQNRKSGSENIFTEPGGGRANHQEPLVIKPTVGRVMWYHPGPGNGLHHLKQHDPAQPMVAHVCYVWDDHMVNLLVIDHDGFTHRRTSIPIVQEGSPWMAGSGPYAEWMPYQKGQAAKAEAAEAKLAAKAD